MNAVIDSSPLTMLFEQNNYLPHLVWLRDLQKAQLAAFSERHFPTRREERWKYTDVSFVAKKFQENLFSWSEAKKLHDIEIKVSPSQIRLVFVNGYFSQALSQLDLLANEIILLPLSQALKTHEELIKSILTQPHDVNQHPFAGLNTALMTDGLFLFVPENAVVTQPIHCLFINTDNNTLTAPRNIIVAEANSAVTLIEEYIGKENLYFTNTLTEIVAGRNAKINHYKIQHESMQAAHMANVFIDNAEDSLVKNFSLSRGAHLHREDINATVGKRGAECQLHGFYYLTEDNQHVDYHLHVDHSAAHGISKMSYKGILNKKSHAVFNGKVHVHKDAKHISAHQANHNLLLSTTAAIDTKPELEIYADDVKCTHGATVGQLDLESLFYLRSRGIAKEEAMELLTQAFAVDVFDAIEDLSIKAYILQQADFYHE
jgi:Fe-S cluster assembly protein SufD